MIWQLQEAKSKFSKLVKRAMHEGPQIVTRHGQEVVVVLSVKDYRRLAGEQTSLLDLLLNSPLVGSGLEIRRERGDFGRAVEL